MILERLPLTLHRVKGRIERDAMAMQMPVQSTRAIVLEHRGTDIASCLVTALAVLANARCSKELQLIQRDPDGLLMRLDNPAVIANKRRNGYRFRRRERKIVEDAPIGAPGFLTVWPDIHARCLLPDCQRLASAWMKIFAKPHEIIFICDTGQPQVFSAFAIPLPLDSLAFGVIIARREVFLEVLFGT